MGQVRSSNTNRGECERRGGNKENQRWSVAATTEDEILCTTKARHTMYENVRNQKEE